MERRGAAFAGTCVGMTAGAVGGLILSLIFNPGLLAGHFFSCLAQGAFGGLGGLAGVMLLSPLLGAARALRWTVIIVVGLFALLTLGYYANKWRLAGNAFTSTQSLLYDLAVLVVSWVLAVCVARGIGRFGGTLSAAGRALAGATVLFIAIPMVGLIALSARGSTAATGAPSDRLSLVLVSVDTLRPDHLGCYGYPRPTSPNFDRLAAGGVRFENVCCPVPQTSPSHATILTGRSPQSHGVRANGYALPDSVVTVAEVLRSAGYATGGFTGCVLLDDRFGFSQGFDTFVQSGHVERLAPVRFNLLVQSLVIKEIFDRLRSGAGGPDPTILCAAQWLEQQEGRPFFLFIHLLDPHSSYEPAEPFRSMFPPDTTGLTSMLWARQGRDLATLARNVALYDAEIAGADAKIGQILRLLDAMGRREKTVVVITGDHGENLGQHEPFFAHWDVYDSVMRVPLILNGPGTLPAGRVVDALVENSAIAPTILALVGQPIPISVDGENVASLILNSGRANRASEKPTEDERFAVAFATRYAIRSADWKLMVDFEKGKVELYDLVQDPNEYTDVTAMHEERAVFLERKLREILERREGVLRVRPSVPIPVETLDRRTLEALKGLGYIDQ